jgi:integrase
MGKYTMARRGLTALAVENAKPGAQRREISDGRGLFLVVQPSGAKSWAYRYRFAGRPAKLTFEGPLTLAAARKLAADARHKVEQGIDPGVEKREAKATEHERQADTVGQCVGQFIELHCRRRLRTWKAVERIFKAEVLPRWHGKTVHEIRKRDVIRLNDELAADRPILANRTYGWIRKFFAWLGERDVLTASPCNGIRMPARETARDRVLSDAEIVRFWYAASADAAGPLLKLLLLLGQRRGETAGMLWSELDERTWSIPSSRTKNAKAHSVPLSRQARDIIQALPRIDARVFAAVRGLYGFDACKKRIDAAMGPEAPWVIHDLRRTLATGLQRLGVRLEVTEAVLNHASGSRSGIVGVYQRHDWKDEKAAALQAWADHVEALVSGKPAANVVRLAQSR